MLSLLKRRLSKKFVISIQANADEEPPDNWVDNYEVCTFLKISPRTLQRLRAANLVSFSRIRGKNFYRIVWTCLNTTFRVSGAWGVTFLTHCTKTGKHRAVSISTAEAKPTR